MPKRKRESLIQADLIDFLEYRDWLVEPTHGNLIQKGFPDLFCHHLRWQARWIDVKVRGQYQFTKHQKIKWPRWESHGVGIWILTAATDEEYAIMYRTTSGYSADAAPLLDASRLCATIDALACVRVPDEVLARANDLVRATRPDAPAACPLVKEYVSWGAGPRATQAMIAASRARAALHGRTAPTLKDVGAVTLPALRHRLVLSHHARAEGIDADTIIEQAVGYRV